MRIAFLTCALLAAACSHESKPAQDPSSSTSTTSSTTLTHAPTDAPPSAIAATPPTDPASATDMPAAAPALTAPPMATQSDSDSAPRPGDSYAAGGAAVANDPGAHDQTKNADNTKINDRDRRGTLTPMNQGNSKDELKITAAIRRGLMGDKSLSFTAKNVKVITVGSKVTLRGPVTSDQEKSAIEAHAKQTPGVTDVDDQIEVKK